MFGDVDFPGFKRLPTQTCCVVNNEGMNPRVLRILLIGSFPEILKLRVNLANVKLNYWESA
jgi:hypothetical protein